MLTAQQLDALERDARRPDYGSKCYKPDVVLKLIEHIRAIEPKQQELFGLESRPLKTRPHSAPTGAAFGFCYAPPLARESESTND